MASRFMITRARELRREPTKFEGWLWKHLRELNARGCHFRRQVPFRNYVLDFADHSARIVIEIDGEQHGESDNRVRDAARDALLASQGYRVLRFWNHELKENLAGVVETIAGEVFGEPHPTRSARRPPHKGEV